MNKCPGILVHFWASAYLIEHDCALSNGPSKTFQSILMFCSKLPGRVTKTRTRRTREKSTARLKNAHLSSRTYSLFTTTTF